ncbi:MAG TPA: DNA phosphorothioation system sulfurtransferase DndC [Ignavibacteriaceae bacterium]|nr:DNA phosphorothioation system sulfurtransferase DndC [Ignavibacteriaceae bacterium]
MFDLKIIQKEIIEQYLEEDSRPWIIGFSGGKDSTMLLQIVWYALKSIPTKSLRRKIYVVCNNTLVENPKILEYTDKVLKKIEKSALEQSLPIMVHRTQPQLEDSFWVNLIGKGYPAPNNSFRWCTERLKINPTTKFILEKISETGEVIILLGTRYSESVNRANSLAKHERSGRILKKHVLPNAYVYTPIQNIITEDVWTYLLQVPSPWHSSNKELVTIYRTADGGDCPLVIDKSTPSCGNSRFGCWVCTVVTKDKSMEGLIENGEEWMEPLLEIREYLNFTRYDRDSRLPYRRSGAEGVGPYKSEVRKNILEKVLLAQKEIQVNQPNIELVLYQELVAIQVLWYRDNIFDFSVSDIYNSIYGTTISFSEKFNGLKLEKDLLNEVCKESPEDFKLILDLITIQKTRSMLLNKRGLNNDFDTKLSRYISEKVG